MSERESEREKELEAVSAALREARAELDREREKNRLLSAACTRRQHQLRYSQKMAALGSLLAGILHEIKTPVGAIHSMQDTLIKALGKLKRLLDGICPEGWSDESKIQSTLKVIEDANHIFASGSSRTLEIVQRVRKFARQDLDEMQETDLHTELDDTLLLLHHELKDRVKVVREYGEIPAVVCNTGQINQVFLNVLVNAAQAIEEAGTITLRTSAEGDRVHVVIEDSGTGMTPEQLARVFEPGFTTKRVGMGTGIGLAICREIVTEHRGRIDLQSVPGQGTTVRITLPAREAG